MFASKLAMTSDAAQQAVAKITTAISAHGRAKGLASTLSDIDTFEAVIPDRARFTSKRCDPHPFALHAAIVPPSAPTDMFGLGAIHSESVPLRTTGP